MIGFYEMYDRARHDLTMHGFRTTSQLTRKTFNLTPLPMKVNEFLQ